MIAAGAFSGFQHIVHMRASRDHIGFGRETIDAVGDAIALDFSLEDVENVANFASYGFLPELIARFTRIVPFSALNATTLKEILTVDVIARMTREFKSEGLEVVIADEVLDRIVGDAMKRETGARGLSATLTQYLESAAFSNLWPQREPRKR